MTKFIFLGILLSSLLVGCSSNTDSGLKVAALENGSGFGGTGIIQRLADEEGSGFGGTGIIGNIRAFGSILVNGIKIVYDDDVSLESNLNLKNEQLKLGQQVILETNVILTSQSLPKTQKISIFYPIAGRIDAVKKGQIQVQNQWIEYSNNTFKDDGLTLNVGDFVIVNATQINNNHWLASRFNLNKDHIVHFQTKMELNFSTHVQSVVINPRLANMQWQNSSKLFNQQNKNMIIGQWDHHNQALMKDSIQQREMMRQIPFSMERPASIINNMNELRPNIRNLPIRNNRQLMPNRP